MTYILRFWLSLSLSLSHFLNLSQFYILFSQLFLPPSLPLISLFPSLFLLSHNSFQLSALFHLVQCLVISNTLEWRFNCWGPLMLQLKLHIYLSLSLSLSLSFTNLSLSFFFTAWSSFSPLLRTSFYRSFLSVPCFGLFDAAIGSTYFVSFGFCCNIPSHNSFHPFHSISLFIYFTFPPWGTSISVIWSPIFNTFRDSNIAWLQMNGETLARLYF